MKEAKGSKIHDGDTFSEGLLVALDIEPVEFSHILNQLHPTFIAVFIFTIERNDFLFRCIAGSLKSLIFNLLIFCSILFCLIIELLLSIESLPTMGEKVSMDLIVEGVRATGKLSPEHYHV